MLQFIKRILEIFDQRPRITSTLIAIASMLPLIVFVAVFHDLPWGNPVDFADFATYLSGMLLPLFTLLTVLALVATILGQNKQFTHQQRRETFKLYLVRFDKKLDIYERLANTPIAYKIGGENFSFREIAYIQGDTTKSAASDDLLAEIDLLMDIVRKEQSLADIPKDSYKTLIFTIELLNSAVAVIRMINSIYNYANNDDKQIVKDIRQSGIDILSELKGWKILAEDHPQTNNLKNLLDRPKRLK